MVKLKPVLLGAVLLFGIVTMQAQTKNDAIISFNEGVVAMKTMKVDSLNKAIKAFEKSVAICEQLGDSANDVKSKAIAVIPDLYFQKAKVLASEKKWSEAIAACKDAIKVSDKYNDQKVKEASQNIIVQSYVVLGGTYIKSNEYDKAIKSFDSAININPNYTKAYYNKAIAYMRQENTSKFQEQSELTIEKAKAENDTITANQMTKFTGEYFTKIGIKNMKAGKLSEAINNFNTALKYNMPPKDIYYYLASTYNKQNKFDDAASYAQKGLDLETGAPEAKAKFYFELATAQAGKNDKENACANYKKANYGQFVTAVKAQLQNLQCK